MWPIVMATSAASRGGRGASLTDRGPRGSDRGQVGERRDYGITFETPMGESGFKLLRGLRCGLPGISIYN